MKTKSLFAVTSLALTSAVMASPPVDPAGLEVNPAAKQQDAIQVAPKIAICREAPVCNMPAPVSRLMQLKDMEANGDAIESILGNEKLKTTIEKLKAPIVVGSMEDAAKYLTRASIEKINVDFDKQQIAIFAWQGSGQDRLNGHLASGKDAAAQLYYIPGRTKDLRTHSTVYSMPKGTKVNVNKQQIIRCGVGELDGRPMQLEVEPGVQKLEIQIEPLQKRGE